MVKGQGYPSDEKRLKVLRLFNLERSHIRVNVINGYKSLKEGCKERNDGFSSVVPSDRKEATGTKRMCCLNIKKHFFTATVTGHCNRMWTLPPLTDRFKSPRHYAGKLTVDDLSLAQGLD